MSTRDTAPCDDLAPALRHAARYVAHYVAGTPVDDGFPSEADREVGGAFVTLRRGRHLRACCGILGGRFRLSHAVEQAARRTALDDQRFPVIQPTELAYLTVEVSLLHHFEQLDDSPSKRRQAVEVGRHGLTIRRDGRSGLLLPQVAEEQGWDRETFLRQVAVKAGLPTSAWEDPGATLERFEASHQEGRLTDLVALPQLAARATWSRSALTELEHLAGRNIAAMRQGATAAYPVPALPDGDVDGVALWIGDPTQPGRVWMRYVMRGGVPLQATLYELAQAAAGSGREGRIGLAVLHHSVPLGTAEDFDREGFSPATHALGLLDQGTMTLAFDRHATVDELWQRLNSLTPPVDRATARVVSVECGTPRDTLLLGTRPAARSQPAARPPAVAGRFYPDTPEALDQLLNDLWPTGPASPARWPAAMVPHAGLVYSGAIAADVLRRIDIPPVVIVIGPKHTRLGVPWAVAPVATWHLPGTTVAGDLAWARRLAEAIDGLTLDAAAHQSEHAIEVELPILHRLAPDVRVVGVAISGGSLDVLHRAADQLAGLLDDAEEHPLLLISSDMNHFANDDETRRLDRLALDAMSTGEPDRLYEVVHDHRISMCGVLPAVLVLSTLQRLGHRLRCEEVAYDTSARVTGDRSRVVGYAGMLIGPAGAT